MANRRDEDGPVGKAGVLHDFRHVLVGQAEGIEFEGGFAVGVVHFDHLAAAAGVAANGVDRDRLARRDDATVDQRPKKRDRPRGVAARIADTPRTRDRLRLQRFEFGKSVGPAFRRSMRCARVQNARRAFAEGFGDSNRFARGLVRKAENDDVYLCHDGLALFGVLAIGWCDADDLVRAAVETFPDL